MVNFFFDTADENYIKDAWSKLEGVVDPKFVSGITTNPNAFMKMDMLNLDQWEKQLPILCKTVSEIRGDDKGVVYVQAPNSNMEPSEVLRWAKHISKFNDGTTKLGLKIPPFKSILEIVPQLNEIMEVNVTGVAECSTALHCFTYDVRYVSIIPGRMEEKGIDAKAHIAYVNQRSNSKSDIITGSMRTLEGLKWVCEMGTVPTIGTKVWDLIFDQMGVEEFNALERINPAGFNKFSPLVSAVSNQLSVDFFDQMDACGETTHKQFAIK
tara:strand:+ start:11421 stop:12224 length:804 start_codon:yes stop_codon:yes gene_type:complete